MQKKKTAALLPITAIVNSSSQQLSTARPLFEWPTLPQPRINCAEIQMGTKENLADVVANGSLSPEFLSAHVEFSQNEPHTFYINGAAGETVSSLPTVFSISKTNDDSALKEFSAFTRL